MKTPLVTKISNWLQAQEAYDRNQIVLTTPCELLARIKLAKGTRHNHSLNTACPILPV